MTHADDLEIPQDYANNLELLIRTRQFQDAVQSADTFAKALEDRAQHLTQRWLNVPLRDESKVALEFILGQICKVNPQDQQFYPELITNLLQGQSIPFGGVVLLAVIATKVASQLPNNADQDRVDAMALLVSDQA